LHPPKWGKFTSFPSDGRESPKCDYPKRGANSKYDLGFVDFGHLPEIHNLEKPGKLLALPE
jgi:hypothetical protein